MGGAVMGTGTWVGLDVHAKSVVAGLIQDDTGELRVVRAPHRTEELVRWVGELDSPVRVAYEAGPTGFGLARALEQEGIGCVVAAPSLIARSPVGRNRKNDAADAEHLARLLRAGELVAVRVPGPADEAARDLVRAREDARADLMRARHRLSKLLLRHGLVYEQGRAWTRAHDVWLRRQHLEHPAGRHSMTPTVPFSAPGSAATPWIPRSANWPVIRAGQHACHGWSACVGSAH